MSALARGQASSCQNPQLELYTPLEGVLTDVYSLEFQIYDVSTAETLLVPEILFPDDEDDSVREEVDVDTTCPDAGAGRISTGRYVAEWTPADDLAVGRYRIVWYLKRESTSEEEIFEEDFDVLDSGTVRETGYALVADLRGEGVTAALVSDAAALALLVRAARFIEKATKRFFVPRARTYRLDGSGAASLHMDHPIIAVGTVAVDGSTVDADAFVTYNRHITQGLTDPDDRNNPRLEYTSTAWPAVVGLESDSSRWTRGRQNVSVEGVFGYTDLDARSTVGTTPELIRRVALMLAVRDMAALTATDDRFEAMNRGRLKEERTRDQSYSLSPGRMELAGKGGATPWTDDPEINQILDMYRAPPTIRVP